MCRSCQRTPSWSMLGITDTLTSRKPLMAAFLYTVKMSLFRSLATFTENSILPSKCLSSKDKIQNYEVIVYIFIALTYSFVCGIVMGKCHIDDLDLAHLIFPHCWYSLQMWLLDCPPQTHFVVFCLAYQHY